MTNKNYRARQKAQTAERSATIKRNNQSAELLHSIQQEEVTEMEYEGFKNKAKATFKIWKPTLIKIAVASVVVGVVIVAVKHNKAGKLIKIAGEAGELMASSNGIAYTAEEANIAAKLIKNPGTVFVKNAKNGAKVFAYIHHNLWEAGPTNERLTSDVLGAVVYDLFTATELTPKLDQS